jgi:hypothetical protein
MLGCASACKGFMDGLVEANVYIKLIIVLYKFSGA